MKLAREVGRQDLVFYLVKSKMKGILKLGGAVALSCLATQTAARAVAFQPDQWIAPYKREVLQDIVTWDKDSIFVNGERIVLYSGEM